ncbi:hypothetical protein HK105_203461 [Polyrhizophydium stewartii]|uniref:Ankyrin repeat protein n=1 Tax=Polyrhizophydium stewartii TaxID=2732419 RepID=A0ABR4NC61_9FUNG
MLRTMSAEGPIGVVRRRRIQAEEQHFAEQEQQHPPAPPLPAGASHWDRLPTELHGMIIEASGPLTKLAVGAITHEELDAASREEQRQVWEDALATDWQCNLGLLPVVALGTESILLIDSRSMYARVSALNILAISEGLRRCAIAHEWRDLIDLDEYSPGTLAEDAATVGALWLLRELIDERRSVEPSERLATTAARSGQLAVIKFLHERSPDGSWSQAVATAAIIGGHIDVAEWLLANRSEGCDRGQLYEVIRSKHPDSFVKMIVNRGWMEVDTDAVYDAAASRSVDMVQYLRTKGGDELFDADIMNEAASNSAAMLEWLHREFGFVPTMTAVWRATQSGAANAMVWLRETTFPDI